MSHDLDLTPAADRFDIPPGDVDTVIARGRRRTNRRRAATATLTVVALVAGAVTFIGARGNDGDGGSTNIAAQNTENAKLGDDPFTWTRRGDAKNLAWTPAVGGSGPLYALSTGPGERDMGNARQNGYLYRSADGVDWQSVSRFGNDMFLSDLAPTSQRVYGVGTGPATALVPGKKASDLVAGWSDDGGEHWTKASLPFDMRAVVARSTQASVMDTEVASSDKGTLVVAAVRALLDVPRLLPDGATAPNGWATTPDGVDVLGPKRTDVCPAGTSAEKGEPGDSDPKSIEIGPTYCYDKTEQDRSKSVTVVPPQQARGVTASYSWDQLGITGDVRRAARGELLAFFAEAGSTDFRPVDMGGRRVGAPILALAVNDGFDIVAAEPQTPNQAGNPGVFTMHSADGRTWSPTAPANGIAFASSAGLLGSTPVVFGGTEQGAPVMMRRTADGWATTDLSNLIARPANTQVYAGASGVGPAGAALTVTVFEMEGQNGRRFEQREIGSQRLLTTRDGVTWHDQSLDELVGKAQTSIQMIAVTDDHVVLSAVEMKQQGAPNGPAPRITMVGTPR